MTDSIVILPQIPGPLNVLKREVFSSPMRFIITMVFLVPLVWLIVILADWAIFSAIWSKENVSACTKDGAGACWSVIHARYRLIFFGLYPHEEHWRSALACLAIIVTVILSCLPVFWTAGRIAATWIIGFATFYILMRGGILGLSPVETSRWGGLSLTVFIFASVVLIGMPLSIVLALARRSKMPVIKMLASGAIDLTRSFPLLTILFTAAVILPFILPTAIQGDKLYRVIGAFAFFFACYQAEILRGGLQTIQSGQEEAASALGMGYWDRVWFILLPQAFRNSLPPTVNQTVVTFKETSVVVIIGFFDVLASSAAAVGTGEWSEYYKEVYVFVALIYFVFVFSLSRYGAYLERRMRAGND